MNIHSIVNTQYCKITSSPQFGALRSPDTLDLMGGFLTLLTDLSRRHHTG